MVMCIAQVDFTERSLYAFKIRLEVLMFSFTKKILIHLGFLYPQEQGGHDISLFSVWKANYSAQVSLSP